MIMKNQIDLKLDIYNACRTNTDRALKHDGHYNFPLLVQISGARFEDLLEDLKWCAEHKEDDWAIEAVQHFAEALLSAYDIQRKTYV